MLPDLPELPEFKDLTERSDYACGYGAGMDRV